MAFHFGTQKINVHVSEHEFAPTARKPTPAALDLCFIASCPLMNVIAKLNQLNWPIEEGPVDRTGARVKIRFSEYVEQTNNA